MLYHHHFLGGSAVSASSPRRSLSLWGLGAAAGLLSFPLRARAGEAEPVPDGLELAGELCPAPAGGDALALLEACDSAAEAEAFARDPALLTVLGGDVRPSDLPVLPGLPEQQAELILSQTSEGTAAGGGGLFGFSWPVVALAGGGGLLVFAAVASGGSDSGGGNGNGDNGGGPGPGGTDSNNAPTTTTDAPTVPLTVDEAAADTWDLSDWFDDPNTGDTLTYAVSGNPTWLELDAAMGELTIAASATDADDIASHTFTVTASDDDDETAVLTVTLTVENVNDAPVLTDEAPTTPLTVDEAAAETWTLADWFRDPDTGDTLTYTAMGLPSWLAFDAAKGELTIAAGETDDAQVGSHTLVLTATDSDNESVSHTVTVTVENVAEAPVTTTLATTSLTAMEGLTAANWDASDWFSDPDTAVPNAGDVLTYTGMVLQGAVGSQTEAALPDWLVLDGATGALTIAAGATDDHEIGTYTLAITARDTTEPTALTVSHTATLEITDTENDPFLSNLALTNPRIAPPTGESLVLDNLAAFFTDLQENGNTPGALTFTVSDSIDDTMMAENIITAELTGGMLVLTPGAASGPSGKLWQQETVTITATDSDGQGSVAAFTVTTRANVLDTSSLAPAHGFIIQGDMAGDNLGRSVSGAGDINGDGLDDLIVGAPEGYDGDIRAGEAYIVYGKAGTGTQFGMADATEAMRQVVDTTNLAPADGFIIQGDAMLDHLGWSVARAGDVNGDGFDDLITGARWGNDGGIDAGEAYIVYGKTGTGDGTQFGSPTTTEGMTRQVVDTASLAPADGFIIQGDVIADNLGWSAVGVGDINGDGLDDLIAGAPGGDDGDAENGEAYVIYGKANPADGPAGTQFGTADSTEAMRRVVDTTELSPTDGFILQGDMVEDWLGTSVSGAGDINGDGVDDLIVGAYQGDDGGMTAGEAYVIYGKAGATGTQFGMAVRLAANGAPLADGVDPIPDGSVLRQVLDISNLAPAAGFILQGDTAGDALGWSVAGAGDINGDGLDDLIIGARLGADGGTWAGEAYIIYGKAGDGTQFGVRVAIAGGTTTPLEDDDSAPPNSVVRRVLDTTELAAAAGFIIQGDAFNDQLGYSVSGAGDVNGDGLADLIVGARNGNDGGNTAGEAYIVYGKAGTDGAQFGTAVTADSGETRQVLDTTGLAPTDGFILQGDAEDDELGISVSGAGDVNGDGFDDLIAGANEGGDGGGDAGEAYVVYGGSHLGEVVSHAQTLVGMAGDEFLLGGAGDDRLEAHADTEVLYGGAGDDVLSLADADFRRVDGGSGNDRLVLGSGVVLDFTEASVRGKVRGIEVVSLSDATAMVTLDLASVYALVESRDNGGDHTSAGEAFLRLRGLTSDTVVLSDKSDWTKTDNAEGTADLYTQDSAKLLIDDGLVA